ncbi:MAG: HIT family protein [Candidatus Bathyarchaeota archaeon]|nr:HIT family protein [Candidatus Termiticorpusculum sp.]
MPCRFCDLLLQEDNDTLIMALKYGKLFLNFNQCFNGRVMYVLSKHYNDIAEIELDEYCAMSKELLVISKVIKDIFSPDLINVVSLGNHVQHTHWHIIPRYKDDSNWGHPPWPHGKNILSSEELKLKSKFIREQLMQNEYFRNLALTSNSGGL